MCPIVFPMFMYLFLCSHNDLIFYLSQLKRKHLQDKFGREVAADDSYYMCSLIDKEVSFLIIGRNIYRARVIHTCTLTDIELPVNS